MSDQLSSYSTLVRKSIKWYHKVAAEFLFGTTVVNAFVLYKKLNQEKKFTIIKFREELVDSLLELTKMYRRKGQVGKKTYNTTYRKQRRGTVRNYKNEKQNFENKGKLEFALGLPRDVRGRPADF